MDLLSFTVHGVMGLQKQLNDAVKREKKALETAMRVEAHGLMMKMRQEIRQGAPGGQPFPPLTALAKLMKGKRASGKPLIKTANLVRYAAFDLNGEKAFSVGFQVHGALSERWKYLLERHQEGFTRPVTSSMRVTLLHKGATMRLRYKSRYKNKKRQANVFFLRKSTTQFRTPPRPIINPFWHAHKDEAWRHIRNNFRRKLRGERI